VVKIAAAVALLLMTLPATGWAQAAPRRATLAIGYSALRETGDAPATYPAGWVVAVASAPAGGIGLVGEIGANYRAPAGLRQTLSSYQGGARVALTGRLTGFVQFLAGLERFSEPGFQQNGFALQPGGGVDVPITGRASLRGQADYRIVRVGGNPGRSGGTFKELRASVGIVIGF
jgi:hypothetical protein